MFATTRVRAYVGTHRMASHYDVRPGMCRGTTVINNVRSLRGLQNVVFIYLPDHYTVTNDPRTREYIRHLVAQGTAVEDWSLVNEDSRERGEYERTRDETITGGVAGDSGCVDLRAAQHQHPF